MRDFTQPDEGLSDAQHQTRALLLEVATEHFAWMGYRKASVAQIARKANVGKGSVYLYFESKEQLLVTCIMHEKMRLLPHLEAVLSLPPHQQLEALIRVNATFIMSAPLCGALIRGDDDFEALKRSLRVPLMSPEDQRLDEARTWALYDTLIRALNPNISEEMAAPTRDTILATLPALAYLRTPAQRAGMSVDHFAEHFARLTVRGVTSSAVAQDAG